MDICNTLIIEKRENQKLYTVKNIVLLIYVVLETLYKTIFGMYIGEEMDRLQCIVAIMLIGLFITEFLRLDMLNKKKFLKKNVFVFMYFAVRLVTFINVGMEYTMVRSVIFEVVYLMVFTELVVTNEFCKKVACKFLIISNLILNLVNVCIYHIIVYMTTNNLYLENEIYTFIIEKTYVDDYMGFINSSMYSSMYSNPNQIGLMTGIAILLSLNFVSKNMPIFRRVAYACYFLFSLYCIWLSNCSSAVVGMVIAMMAIIAVKKTKVILPKRMILICLVGAIVASISVYAFCAVNGERGSFTELERLLL